MASTRAKDRVRAKGTAIFRVKVKFIFRVRLGLV
jgi:hypothetical protein